MAARKPLPRKLPKTMPVKTILKEEYNQMNSSFSHLHEIGKDPGIEVWKQIDETTLEKIIKRNQGSFQTDRCYIVLETRSPDGSAKSFRLHSWFGDLVKTNESLTSACDSKVRELEVFFQDHPLVVFREIQGSESKDFLSYFKSGIEYISPVELKKTDADTKKETKLYHLKGRRVIRVKRVDPKVASLNSGDVFIVDADDSIYQWNGKSSSTREKGKALDLTARLRDERGAKAKVIIFEEGKEEGPDGEKFWEILGGKSAIQSAEDGGDDAECDNAAVKSMKLFKLSATEGEVEVTEEGADSQGVFDTAMLNTNNVFILSSDSEIFIWAGKSAPQNLKTQAMQVAKGFIKEFQLPEWTPIMKVHQGAETTLFKDKFKKGSWNEFVGTYEQKLGNIAKVKQDKVNIDELHHPERYVIAKEELRDIIPSAHTEQNANKPSILKIWYVKDHKLHELPAEEHGTFYSENAYVIVFQAFLGDASSREVCYYWIGRRASQDDKGSAALLSSEVTHTYGRSCIQVRVMQNKGPLHLLSHFNKKFVVRIGKREQVIDKASYSALFHIRGQSHVNTTAFQLDVAAHNLNSNDPFILITPSYRAIWSGKGTNKDERDFAKTLSASLVSGEKFEEVEEGQESEAFWKAIGGKQSYASSSALEQELLQSRLFQCSNAKGAFRVFEILNFSQDDLDNDDVMILDANDEIFVWVGTGSNELEKKMSMDTATEYVKTAPGDRAETPISVIQAGMEPPTFTCHFHGWDRTKAQHFEDPFIKKLNSLQSRFGQMTTSSNLKELMKQDQEPSTPTSPATPAATSASAEDGQWARQPVVAAASLKKKPYPEGVDPGHLERHLSDADFASSFKMSRSAFEKLPTWKQLNVKKSLGFF